MTCLLVIWLISVVISSSFENWLTSKVSSMILSFWISSSLVNSSRWAFEWSRIKPFDSCSASNFSLMSARGYFLPLTMNTSSTISLFLRTKRLYCFGSKASPSLRHPSSINFLMLFFKFSSELGKGTDISLPIM